MTVAECLLEEIHPSIWRASQFARSRGRTIDTGYASLSAELPGGGWPVGALVELLLQRSGIGEFRLLQLALASLGKRPIALGERWIREAAPRTPARARRENAEAAPRSRFRSAPAQFNCE